MSSSSQIALSIAAAGSAALLLYGAKRALSPADSPPKDIPEDIDDMMEEEAAKSESDFITEDDVVSIFEKLYTAMNSVLAQLSAQIQQLQMAGQRIPEDQLRQLLKQEFERSLTARQGQVFEEADVDEDCLKEAVWEMMGEGEKYPRAKKAVERFQKLWENVSGEKVVGRMPGDRKGESDGKGPAKKEEPLPADKLVEAATVYFDALTAAMGDVVKRMKAEGKTNLRDPNVAQAMHMEFASTANEAGEEALKGMGITLDRFRDSIDRHAQNPEVGRTLAMLQMKQQQELMAMGVPAMG